MLWLQVFFNYLWGLRVLWDMNFREIWPKRIISSFWVMIVGQKRIWDYVTYDPMKRFLPFGSWVSVQKIRSDALMHDPLTLFLPFGSYFGRFSGSQKPQTHDPNGQKCRSESYFWDFANPVSLFPDSCGSKNRARKRFTFPRSFLVFQLNTSILKEFLE